MSGNPNPGLTPAAQAKHDPHVKKEVGGWLLVLCFLLTVVNPLLTVAMLYAVFSLVTDFPKLMGRAILVSAVAVPLMCYSIYAGLALWKIKPRATTIAKNYLLAVFFCSLLNSAISLLILMFSSGQARRSAQESFSLSVISTVFTLIGVSVWYSYLNRSTRVGETYGEATGTKNITLKLNR